LSANTTEDGVWTHFAVVFKGNKVKLYQNGILTSETIFLTKLSDYNFTKWYLGNNPELNHPMTGYISNVQIYHSALSDNQIQALKADADSIPAVFVSGVPYSNFPLQNDFIDTKGNTKILANSNTAITDDALKGSATSINEGGYLKFPETMIGKDKSTIAFLIKPSTFANSDSGKYVMKYQSAGGDYYGLRMGKSNGKWDLQLISSISGKLTVIKEGAIGSLSENGWNSIVFVQTYTALGTAAIRVYVNGVASLVVAKADINTLPCTNICFGDANEGFSYKICDLNSYKEELTSVQVVNYNNSETKYVNFTAEIDKKHQTMSNFGSSDARAGIFVGQYFSEQKKESLAELLFSTEDDSDGNPKGIGLSSWRFNIGAGTAEQGTASRITSVEQRTECFLNADGTYDWTKQAGQQWFLEKAAKTYHTAIIGWQNSPPVQFTKRGLGFNEYGDGHSTILRSDKYNAFGEFLTKVVNHFNENGIKIGYVSPLNEPQYEWTISAAGANAEHEGSPWTNEEIHDVVVAINSAFETNNTDSKILVGEAGHIDCLYSKATDFASDQLNELWSPTGTHYFGKLSKLAMIPTSHSYWTDKSASTLCNTRMQLGTILETMGLGFWETEYSLLGTGYRFGHPSDRTLTPMESGISLARVIHNDLKLANASGWQWWTTFEMDANLTLEDRFALIPVALKSDNSDGIYRTTKLLYTLGNYSRFVRPGMVRVDVNRSDNMSDEDAVANQMVTGYYDTITRNVVFVAVNASSNDACVRLGIDNFDSDYIIPGFIPYLTSETDNLKRYPVVKNGASYLLPGTSVVTFVGKAEPKSGLQNVVSEKYDMSVYPNPICQGQNAYCSLTGASTVRVIDMMGNEVSVNYGNGQSPIQINTDNIAPGLYIVSAYNGKSLLNSRKIVIK
jgi:O-glycosyl hydrolase